jgi:hypothetical protein
MMWVTPWLSSSLEIMPAYPMQLASREPFERRVRRMREQLAKGGDAAQGALLDVFPDGFWLAPDPNGGRYLWAHARTALPGDWRSRRDADGYLPAEHWPRVYDAATEAVAPDAATEVVGNSLVAGARN